MNDDFALILTTLSSGSFHIIGLIVSSICGNRHHKSGSTDSIIILTGLFPSVGDILIGPATEVGIQHNHVTRTNIVLRGGKLQIGTELSDVEVSSGGTTGSGSGGHIISTRSGTLNFVVTGSCGSLGRLRPRVRSKTGGSRQDIGRLAVTDDIITDNGKSRSGFNSNSRVGCRENRAVIVVIDRFHHNIVSTRLTERGCVGVSRSSSGKLPVHIPLVSRSREIINSISSLSKVQVVRCSEGDRSIDTDTSISSIGFNRHSTLNFKFRNISTFKDIRLGGTFHRAIQSFHFPLIVKIVSRNRKGVHVSGYKRGRGRTLIPLITLREGS